MAKADIEALAAQLRGLSPRERAALLGQVPEIVTASGGGDALSNPEPAFEEGPHLDDPDIRDAKRRQLRDAGIDAGDDRLTGDMRALLREDG